MKIFATLIVLLMLIGCIRVVIELISEGEIAYAIALIVIALLCIVGIFLILTVGDEQVTYEPQLHVMPPNTGLPSVMFY